MNVYPGFDCYAPPDAATRARLKAETALRWAAMYHVSPSHPAADWNGQHRIWRSEGWGGLPIYVGQEVSGPGSHIMTAAQGALDGQDCVRKMRAEGYGRRTIVALDLEVPAWQQEEGYTEAWAAYVWGGHFLPAAYVSHLIAAEVVASNPGLRLFPWRVPTTAPTTASIADLANPPQMSDLGIDAIAWQFRQNVVLPDFGITVDLDVAPKPDPSRP